MDALVGDVMESIEDWIIYVTTPDDYQNQPFVAWDEKELTDLADFRGKTVVDIGSGTESRRLPRPRWPGRSTAWNPCGTCGGI